MSDPAAGDCGAAGEANAGDAISDRPTTEAATKRAFFMSAQIPSKSSHWRQQHTAELHYFCSRENRYPAVAYRRSLETPSCYRKSSDPLEMMGTIAERRG